MDTYSSGEDLLIKTRKPYTITKQRERWTEEEHNRFLEALKLYGRAWQRIEEHIGTKTAVQIRSHAQKFFSKLEKEALVKGAPIGQALDIDIPPPRPKRKPSNPYPRKTGLGSPLCQIGAKDGKFLASVSSPCCKQVLDLEKEPLPEKPTGDENPTNPKENRDDECSEIFNLVQDTHYSSVSSVNRKSVTPVALNNSGSFMEVAPSLKRGESQDETNESCFTIEFKGNQKTNKSDGNKTVQDKGNNEVSNMANPIQNSLLGEKSEFFFLNCTLPADEMQVTHTYPRHVPVHVIDGKIGTPPQTPFPDMSFLGTVCHPRVEDCRHTSLYTNPSASAFTEHQNSSTRSALHQSFPTFHPPFTPVCRNQDNYQSFLQASSTFWSLIVSTLVQNPAAHAAASFAATFWPYSNMETSVDSPACDHAGLPSRQMNSSPSIATMAAATVAAASAWWAAHGMLPLCGPLQSPFATTPVTSLDTDPVTATKPDSHGPLQSPFASSSAPASANAVPSVDNDQITANKPEKVQNSSRNLPIQDQPLEPECTEAMQAQHSGSISPARSSSDSEQSGGGKLNTGSKVADHGKDAATTELHDGNKADGRKQVDRSSCGSNTASSSEVETDALEKKEKQEKAKEEQNEADANHLAADSNNRRIRSINNINDPWKEVSEGGRMAFQALFSRERLPQSFSPPHALKNGEHQNTNMEEHNQTTNEKDGNILLLDLNSKTWVSCSSHQCEENIPSIAENDGDEPLLTIGLGHGKCNIHRTGFKPYKRCSMEASENRMPNASSQGEEKGPKRIRLEGDASTSTFNNACSMTEETFVVACHL